MGRNVAVRWSCSACGAEGSETHERPDDPEAFVRAFRLIESLLHGCVLLDVTWHHTDRGAAVGGLGRPDFAAIKRAPSRVA